ncbi:DNA helicase, UvrD/REP type, partial [mine drainage metagenome]
MSLNPGQQQAVQADGHCLIVACPGSGKTHTLIKRAERILLEDPQARVAMVTFTRAAADEMRARLLMQAGARNATRVTAGTFHSLALQQFDRLGNGKRPFSIATEAHSGILIAKAWELVVRKFRVRIKRDDLRRHMAYAKANRGHIPLD